MDTAFTSPTAARKTRAFGKELNVEVSESLPELHSDDVLILAVKPQDMEAACRNVRVNGALVLSVAAGLSIDTLSRYLGGTRRIVRTMPNTPGKIGLGVSGMFVEAEYPKPTVPPPTGLCVPSA